MGLRVPANSLTHAWDFSLQGSAQHQIIQVTERSSRSVDVASWDSFAQRCGASMRSAHGTLRGWSLKHRARYDLRLLELHANGPGPARKIGQCALGDGRGFNVFLDKLQLLPGYEEMWPAAMSAILAHTGPGRYEYGWKLNLEPPREDALRQMPDLVIEGVRPLVVDAVDFSQWNSWEDYLRAVSKNIRRNAKRAQADIPDLTVVTKRGIASLAHVRYRLWPSAGGDHLPPFTASNSAPIPTI
jgi:hypothetical protein